MTLLTEILRVAFRHFHEQCSHFITFSGHVTVHICMFNWKVFMAVEFKQTVLFINFYIFYVIMFKVNFSITGKNIFLGGMNHCWLIHLLLRAEARSAGSSCDVWVSSDSIPLWLSSSWLNPCPTEMAPPLTGGLSEVMNLLKREWEMGWWRKVRKHQSSFKATHLVFTFSPGSAWTSGTPLQIRSGWVSGLQLQTRRDNYLYSSSLIVTSKWLNRQWGLIVNLKIGSLVKLLLQWCFPFKQHWTEDFLSMVLFSDRRDTQG